MKAPSPLLGFNNNVRHKGRVFHIQTEDSGVRHPHVITHLFADGGRILKTTKTSYAEHVGQERLAETVRAMMQEQHKAMFIALRDGQFDYLFEEGGQPPASQVVPQAKPATAAPPPPPAPPPPAPPPPVVAAPPPAPPAPEAVIPAPRPVAVPPPAAPIQAAALRPTEPAQPRPSPAPPPLAAAPAPPVAVAAPVAAPRRAAARPTLDVDPAAIHGVGSQPHGIDLDLEALERAAAEAQTPFHQQIQDLPPPPAAVLGQKRGSPGGYSVQTPAPPAAGRRTGPRPPSFDTPPAAPPITPSPPKPAAASTLSSPSARYAPTRPASIFATNSPREGSSIFGEDLISEKSLDEVILSYLAEDLDAPDKK